MKRRCALKFEKNNHIIASKMKIIDSALIIITVGSILYKARAFRRKLHVLVLFGNY